MYKVFILNNAKDSKGVSKYKINRLFILFLIKKSYLLIGFESIKSGLTLKNEQNYENYFSSFSSGLN